MVIFKGTLDFLQVLEHKLMELSQAIMAWVQSCIYTPEKRSNLSWLLKAALLSLEKASAKENLFGFVPEYYVDTTIDICTSLKNHFHPTIPLDDLLGK